MSRPGGVPSNRKSWRLDALHTAGSDHRQVSSDEVFEEQWRQQRAKALLDREVATKQRLPRRQEQLRLPLGGLRRHASLTRPTNMGGPLRSHYDHYWNLEPGTRNQEPGTVGIGFDGSLVALWGHLAQDAWPVTHHDDQGQLVEHVIVHAPSQLPVPATRVTPHTEDTPAPDPDDALARAGAAMYRAKRRDCSGGSRWDVHDPGVHRDRVSSEV